MKTQIKKMMPFLADAVRNHKIKKIINDEFESFRDNWMFSSKAMNKAGYSILLDAHALEKGMSSKEPRCFGVKKVDGIIRCMKDYDSNGWEHDFAYELGVSVLAEYCGFYEEHGWTDEKEYKAAKAYTDGKSSGIKTGAYEIKREDFIDDASIDYDRFLGSRHSFREFEKKKISDEDVRKAVGMAIKSPTACNRQMCKVYYLRSDDAKESFMPYSHGLTGFDNESVNFFVVTYDIASLCNYGEITQGMFNAGLVSMNLVNGLHSLGIGSCFLEFNDSREEVLQVKKILGVPESEKIAVVIAAGYYPEKATVVRSARKPIEEVYREV